MDVEIKQLFSDFSDELKRQISDELDTIGKEAVEELKNTSPKKTGRYSKGWRCTKENIHGALRITVSNRKYQLTHLLENGHLSRDGTSQIKGIPHISPANETAQKKFMDFMGVDDET